MKKLKRVGEHTIYEKHSGRYAVKDKRKQLLHGDEKAAVLLAEGLIKPPLVKAPVAEAPAEAGAEEGTESAAEG